MLASNDGYPLHVLFDIHGLKFAYFLNVMTKYFVWFIRYFGADLEPLQSDPNLEGGYCEALLCRLRFRKVLSCITSLTILDYGLYLCPV